ncbi:MAG: cytochrome c [Holophagales bacterium]|nr:cytochrome c [Holophagales bacterium]MYJ24558.1 cytochrome c [Holophagales bacterium]
MSRRYASLASSPLGPSPHDSGPAGWRRPWRPHRGRVWRRLAAVGAGGRNVLLLLMAFTTSAAAEEPENPYTSGIDVRMGQRQFQSKCTSCHGLDATGGEEADGPDLTTGSFQHGSTDADLYEVIRDGVEGTSMRGLRRAEDQEIWQLVTYLRTLLEPSTWRLCRVRWRRAGRCSNGWTAGAATWCRGEEVGLARTCHGWASAAIRTSW